MGKNNRTSTEGSNGQVSEMEITWNRQSSKFWLNALSSSHVTFTNLLNEIMQNLEENS